MAKYERHVKGSFSRISSRLNAEVLNSGASVNLVDSTKLVVGGVTVDVRVYDKYYMRNSNRASLTLTVAGDENDCYVSAIGAGGGSGAVFNFSWGAEDDFVATVINAMRGMGY